MGQKPTAFIPTGPPEDLVLRLRDAAGATHFIEGGTFRGKTARWAAGHFDRVITIEAAPGVFQRLSPEHGTHANITFLLGDTRELLPDIVGHLTSPAVFWLDSHWSAGDTFGQGDECPLLRELEIINPSALDHVLLIDS